jgi:hypothetical protein
MDEHHKENYVLEHGSQVLSSNPSTAKNKKEKISITCKTVALGRRGINRTFNLGKVSLLTQTA